MKLPSLVENENFLSNRFAQLPGAKHYSILPIEPTFLFVLTARGRLNSIVNILLVKRQ